MMVLPAQVASLKGAEGVIGSIEKFQSGRPEFVIPTTEVKTGPHALLINKLIYIKG
jgi:hypothetical protein